MQMYRIVCVPIVVITVMANSSDPAMSHCDVTTTSSSSMTSYRWDRCVPERVPGGVEVDRCIIAVVTCACLRKCMGVYR